MHNAYAFFSDMIAYTYIGICTGNGTPDMKEEAACITDPLARDGVAFSNDCVINDNLTSIKKTD